MGNNKKKRNKNKVKNISNLPNVSICTPTFNRRPFFKGLIQCIKDQDYPHTKIEWVIIDDGFDKIEDVIEEARQILDIKIIYHYESEQMPLGKKRNLMHSKCSFTSDDSIIVYMDDDDYYPPTRVSHAVKKLQSNQNVLAAGSSRLYIWFNTLDKMYMFGPYGPNHATAGTFAFKRKLLKQSHYEDDAVLAEEKHFLKNYTVPFIQLDPYHTILVFSHEQNTFDKRRLIQKENALCKETSVRCKNIVTKSEQIEFYTKHICETLKDYEPGDVKHKPDVLKEIERKDKIREEQQEKHIQNIKTHICVDDGKGNKKELTTGEVMTIMRESNMKIASLNKINKELTEEVMIYKAKINHYEDKIQEMEKKLEIKNLM